MCCVHVLSRPPLLCLRGVLSLLTIRAAASPPSTRGSFLPARGVLGREAQWGVPSIGAHARRTHGRRTGNRSAHILQQAMGRRRGTPLLRALVPTPPILLPPPCLCRQPPRLLSCPGVLKKSPLLYSILNNFKKRKKRTTPSRQWSTALTLVTLALGPAFGGRSGLPQRLQSTGR